MSNENFVATVENSRDYSTIAGIALLMMAASAGAAFLFTSSHYKNLMKLLSAQHDETEKKNQVHLQALMDKLKNLEQGAITLDGEVKKHQEKDTQSQTVIENLTTELKKLQTNLVQSNDKITQYQEKDNKNQAEVNNLKIKLAKFQNDLSQANEKNSSLEQKVADANAVLENETKVNAEQSRAFERIMVELSQLKNTNENLLSQNTTLNGLISEMCIENNAKQKRIQQTEETIKSLEQVITTKNSDILYHLTKLQERDKKITDLESQNSTLIQAITRLQSAPGQESIGNSVEKEKENPLPLNRTRSLQLPSTTNKNFSEVSSNPSSVGGSRYAIHNPVPKVLSDKYQVSEFAFTEKEKDKYNFARLVSKARRAAVFEAVEALEGVEKNTETFDELTRIYNLLLIDRDENLSQTHQKILKLNFQTSDAKKLIEQIKVFTAYSDAKPPELSIKAAPQGISLLLNRGHFLKKNPELNEHFSYAITRNNPSKT